MTKLPKNLRFALAFAAVAMCCAGILAQEDISDRLAAGGVVELGEGVFSISTAVSPPKSKPLCLRGKGPQKTILKWLADGAGITLAGAANANGYVQNVSYWSLENLTLDGDGHAATALTLNCATQGLIHRCLFTDFRGSAIDATQWWDSMVNACDVVKCGDVEAKQPAVRLRNGDKDGKQCNNLSWIGGRFESNPWVSLFIGADESEGEEFRKPRRRSRVCRFVSVKMHSTLPRHTEHDHVWLTAVDDCSFSGNFTHCGGSAFVLRDANDNSFEAAHIGNSDRAGIEFHGCKTFSVEGITWSRIGGSNKVNYTVEQ